MTACSINWWLGAGARLLKLEAAGRELARAKADTTEEAKGQRRERIKAAASAAKDSLKADMENPERRSRRYWMTWPRFYRRRRSAAMQRDGNSPMRFAASMETISY